MHPAYNIDITQNSTEERKAYDVRRRYKYDWKKPTELLSKENFTEVNLPAKRMQILQASALALAQVALVALALALALALVALVALAQVALALDLLLALCCFELGMGCSSRGCRGSTTSHCPGLGMRLG